MKKFLALVCTLCLLLTALPLTALAADDDWVTLNVEMYDRSIAGFNVEDCWQLHYIQENFGNPNHIKINWIPVSRWEEGTILSTRLAGGTAPHRRCDAEHVHPQGLAGKARHVSSYQR